MLCLDHKNKMSRIGTKIKRLKCVNEESFKMNFPKTFVEEKLRN